MLACNPQRKKKKAPAKKGAPAEQGPAAPNPNFARVDIEVAVPALSDVSSKCDSCWLRLNPDPNPDPADRHEHTGVSWFDDSQFFPVLPRTGKVKVSNSCREDILGKLHAPCVAGSMFFFMSMTRVIARRPIGVQTVMPPRTLIARGNLASKSCAAATAASCCKAYTVIASRPPASQHRMGCRRPKRGKKAQQAAAAAPGADGGALDSIPEADGAAAPCIGAAKPAKPAISDDTLGDGLSLMDRLAGLRPRVAHMPLCCCVLAPRTSCRRARSCSTDLPAASCCAQHRMFFAFKATKPLVSGRVK